MTTPEPTRATQPQTPIDENASLPTITMIVGDNAIDRRVLDQARSLIQAGCKVTVLAAPPLAGREHADENSYPDVPIVRFNKEVTAPKFNVNEDFIPDFLRKDWQQNFDVHDHFLELAMEHPANVYTAHDLPQLPAAAIAAATAGSYLVFDAHELFPDRQFFPAKTIFFLQEVEKVLLPLADKIITVNKSLAETMAIKYNIDLPEVVLNCPSFHDTQLPIVHNDEIRKSLGLADTKKILLFQGSFNLNRNLDKLVLSMNLVANKNVVLVLMGSGDLKDPLALAAEELGLLNTRIFFHPAVQQHELLRYTASADCGIIPYPHVDLNTYYCTPNKLFEFIVAGLPILANDSPELNRFVERQGVGMNKEMRTEADIARAIDTFFGSDQTVWREQVRKLSARYAWEEESRHFIQIYEGLGDIFPKAGMRQVIVSAYKDFSNSNIELALEKAQTVIQIDPDNIDALNLLTDIAYAQVDMQLTLQLAREVLVRDESNAKALRKLQQIQEYTRNMEFIMSM